MKCPHCQGEFDPEIGVKLGVEKGGLSLNLGIDPEEYTQNNQRETPKKGVRGKAREYTQAFELAWKAYPRREQKFEAFAVWLIRAKEVGGEAKLLTLCLGTLKWQVQSPEWEGGRYAPYFERYLKRRKWEDEPMPQAAPETQQDRIRREQRDRDRQDTRKQLEATERQLAKFRPYQNGHPQPGQVQSVIAELAEQKAVTK